MGIFGAILDKLRHHAQPQAGGGTSQTSASAGSPNPGSSQQMQDSRPAGTQQSSMQQPGTLAQTANIDVEAVLSQLASKKGGGGNWRTSIVDTLKLLDMDSSLEARKQLAEELDVHAGAHGSAEQNIALQKALMRKIGENGGKVPDSLKN